MLVWDAKQLTAFRLEIEGQARPKIPSMGSPLKELESVVTGENV